GWRGGAAAGSGDDDGTDGSTSDAARCSGRASAGGPGCRGYCFGGGEAGVDYAAGDAALGDGVSEDASGRIYRGSPERGGRDCGERDPEGGEGGMEVPG